MDYDTYTAAKRPRAMFSKLLSDSREFFAAAKREWHEACRLFALLKEDEKRRHAGVMRQPATDRDLRIAAESALTVATMNYTISIELLLKGFVGITRRFDGQALRTMHAIRHRTHKVLENIPEDWACTLDELYRQSDVAAVAVIPYWNSWSPPNSPWIGDADRLQADTLRQFLQFLDTEKLHAERYSFEKIADGDFRVKISQYEELESFHGRVEHFLCTKAMQSGCWEAGTTIAWKLEDGSHTVKKVKFPSLKDAFEFDRAAQHKG